MNKLYHIMTFGCQMNEHDSEIMAGMLEEMGYSETQKRAEADIILINTCSIRENADKRFFGSLGQLKRLHREKPEMIVGVCGCMMQQQHIIDAIRKKYSWVDLVFGTHNIHELPELVTGILNERQKVVSVWSEHRGIFEGLPSKRRYPFKAFVNITYGCNNFCTYCIVPYTRGRERSRLPEDILKEVRELAADGVKEVMLLGQNVNSYGLADGFEMDFADLIYAINKIEGIERIRFMTSHPKDLSDKLIGAYRDCEKLACHIHLPVQAGSNRVLKRMNRKYTRESYLELIRKLREATDGQIAITTDIIVGFPGETEEDFEETLSLMAEVQYDSAFTFLYSPRPGTPAAEYDDQIPEEVKHERFNRMREVLDAGMADNNAVYEGRIEKVLVEGPSRKNKKTLTGRTESMKIVNFAGTPEMVGRIVKVKITEAKTYSLEGEVTEWDTHR
ncbi:MAG: tRNA (N6-isopentenyl adenosine(37)-C2)-methylthiotransferase MiaB [Firmicutes bacterium]|nr:tRNA (N6-isopentenyl adenosine(37)-C2)-methylthiotransferase MiaB [Bacillota bacterium]